MPAIIWGAPFAPTEQLSKSKIPSKKDRGKFDELFRIVAILSKAEVRAAEFKFRLWTRDFICWHDFLWASRGLRPGTASAWRPRSSGAVQRSEGNLYRRTKTRERKTNGNTIGKTIGNGLKCGGGNATRGTGRRREKALITLSHFRRGNGKSAGFIFFRKEFWASGRSSFTLWYSRSRKIPRREFSQRTRSSLFRRREKSSTGRGGSDFPEQGFWHSAEELTPFD